VVALFVVLWNGACFGYVDFHNTPHEPLIAVPAYLRAELPALPFTMASPALGLLLVFRTNSSYQRWLEARKAWGRIVSHSRNIVRQAAVWLEAEDPDEAEEVLSELALATWVFPRTLWAHLSDPKTEPRFVKELEAAMGADQATKVLTARHRPTRALALLSTTMQRLPIDDKKKVEMDKSAILLGDAAETCERIFTNPVPLVYTRHTARFLSTWLLLVPFALYSSFGDSWNHIALLPAIVLLSMFLFGIDELAVQLEEPFSILPLEKLCDGLRITAEDAVEEAVEIRRLNKTP